MKKTILSLVCLSMVLSMSAQTSPNGKVRAEYDDGRGIVVSYRDGKGWQEIMSLPAHCTAVSKPRKAKVEYLMSVGKKHCCRNAYNESLYSPDLTVRVYDDGVAWSGCHEYTVDFSAARNNWLMTWRDSYENLFPLNREQNSGDRYGYPALFEYRDQVFALLSESCIGKENAATSMWASGRGNVFDLKPEGSEDGGWQTLIIGRLSDVVESTLITDNSEPCRIAEAADWVTPGVASWVYWAYNHGSNDLSIIRQYVDMAMALKLPYVLIDAEWDEMDKVASNGGKTIVDAVKYAVDHGVKPIIWYSSSIGWVDGAPGPKYRLNKPEDREREFAWCEAIGVKGVKIDFFSGDSNENMRFMIELLECAARHHLLVNFHGATIPRGWQRTYPNLVSTEGVYGEEWYNNVATFTDKAACHNATLPFTRNVVGSMDYTPCAFTDSQHPHITTHAHELALTVLFESGIQHLADRPESFLFQPQQVKDFLSELPTAWDETRLLSGYPGEYVVLARRKGKTWYVAGINGTDSTKTISVCTNRLRHLGGQIVAFQDGDEEQQPWLISSPQSLPETVTLKPRGGFLFVINSGK